MAPKAMRKQAALPKLKVQPKQRTRSKEVLKEVNKENGAKASRSHQVADEEEEVEELKPTRLSMSPISPSLILAHQQGGEVFSQMPPKDGTTAKSSDQVQQPPRQPPQPPPVFDVRNTLLKIQTAPNNEYTSPMFEHIALGNDKLDHMLVQEKNRIAKGVYMATLMLRDKKYSVMQLEMGPKGSKKVQEESGLTAPSRGKVMKGGPLEFRISERGVCTDIYEGDEVFIPMNVLYSFENLSNKPARIMLSLYD